MSKPILCLDFDGVIHDYREGWRDGIIYGEPTAGFFDWAERAAVYFRLVVYSSRSKDLIKLEEMKVWIDKKQREWMQKESLDCVEAFFEFMHEKPPAFLTIDDRALTFHGNWSMFDPQWLRNFKPWMNEEKTSLPKLAETNK